MYSDETRRNKNMSVQTTNNFSDMEEKKKLLGIMSAIIYSQISEVSKDNGYGVINAVGQARQLLKEIDKQTSFKA